jgi:hypothetical protein
MRGLRDRARATGVVLFVGPTLAAAACPRELLRGVRVRAPVRRGDVERLVAAHSASRRRPGVIALADGLFHDTLAVGHAELRGALRAGWSVWGLSSMGAIRAREMESLGMRGFGRVFERFRAEGDFQDDEVALLHGPAPDYRAMSEPLVHLRAAADHLVTRGIVAEDAARDAIAALKYRWYGERTRGGAIDALGARARGGPDAVRRELADFRRFELKTLDLVQFLQCRPWIHPGEDPHGREEDHQESRAHRRPRDAPEADRRHGRPRRAGVLFREVRR